MRPGCKRRTLTVPGRLMQGKPERGRHARQENRPASHQLPPECVLNSRVRPRFQLTAGGLSLKVSVSSATLPVNERIHGFHGFQGLGHLSVSAAGNSGS